MTRLTAWGLGVELAVIAGLLTVALDVWAHKRVEQLGGVNMWGYRGAVLPQKADPEIRVALVGGDFAFGWGQGAGGTIAGAVRQLVMLQTDLPGRPLRPVTAVNLSARGLSWTEYAGWIARFAYLQPEVVALLPDPRAHPANPGARVPDRRSLVFGLFGYVPMLPLALEEKGARLDSRLVAGAGRVLSAADHRLARLVLGAPPEAAGPASLSHYLAATAEAVATALDAGAAVTVVTPLRMSDEDAADHDALRNMIAARFDGRRVRFVNLGAEAAMYDPALRLNGFDLSSAGVARAAQVIAPPIVEQVRAVIE